MLSPHSFKLISRVWLEVTESRFIASNEPKKFFGGKKEKKEKKENRET